MTMTETTLQFDQEGTHDYDPGLYAVDGVADPITTLDDFDDAALARYRREGFLAVEEAFSADEVRKALDGMEALLMGSRGDFKGIMYESRAREILPSLSLEERIDAVRKFLDFVNYEPRLAALAWHFKLKTILARILEEPPLLFQDMALIKPPRIGREKPWHQDHAFFDYSMDTRIVGVWIALDEATIENGCMRVLPGAHRQPRLHFKKRDWQICDLEMKGSHPVAVPLRPGGLLLFDGLMPHGTPANSSPNRRRALQFHYRNESAQKTTTEARLEVFGSEGKNVTC